MNDMAALFSLEKIDDPHPLYAELRARAPVFKLASLGFWLVSRYDDVKRVLQTPEIFSSARTGTLRSLMKHARLQANMAFLSRRSLVAADPPDHGRLRALVHAAFSPRAMSRLEDRVRAIAGALVDDIVTRDEVDLMEALAAPLPGIVIAELLGVDSARRADFKRWSDDLLTSARLGEHLDEREIDRLVQSQDELLAFFRDRVALLRRAPGDDLLSDLVRAEAAEALSPDELLAMAILVMSAGIEPPANLIGNAALALLDHPDVHRRLRDDPSLVPAFIEEVLRHRSPVTMLIRSTTAPVTLGGVTLPEDALVIALLEAANRDPEVFPDPDRFDITRASPAHLAFGTGIHACLGALLARLEARVVVEEMARRFPPFSRAPGPIAWHRSVTLRGPRSLVLRFDRAALPASPHGPQA